MPSSVLEAIRQGIWDYEPRKVAKDEFASTAAMPGTKEKLEILAARLEKGVPLWHPQDRNEYEDPMNAKLAR
ncbi:MAG: hypothetical protein DCC68_16265 [Planctomycetota bacterium]|nr:MAG: hypothetical protein DCC68_16265 [Planctomycetota bacterium]